MINELLAELNNIKWFAISEILLIVLLYGAYWFLTNKFYWQKIKLVLFGFLYNLDRKQAICLALSISRLLFVLFSSIFCFDINLGHFIVLEITTMIILILDKDIKSFISNLATFAVIFALLFIQSALYNYYHQVDNYWIVMFMLIMIGAFVVITTSINTINSYEKMLDK